MPLLPRPAGMQRARGSSQRGRARQCEWSAASARARHTRPLTQCAHTRSIDRCGAVRWMARTAAGLSSSAADGTGAPTTRVRGLLLRASHRGPRVGTQVQGREGTKCGGGGFGDRRTAQRACCVREDARLGDASVRTAATRRALCTLGGCAPRSATETRRRCVAGRDGARSVPPPPLPSSVRGKRRAMATATVSAGAPTLSKSSACRDGTTAISTSEGASGRSAGRTPLPPPSPRRAVRRVCRQRSPTLKWKKLCSGYSVA